MATEGPADDRDTTQDPQREDILPDEVVDKHWPSGGPSTAAPPKPEGTDDDFGDDEDLSTDIPDEGPEAELDDDEFEIVSGEEDEPDEPFEPEDLEPFDEQDEEEFDEIEVDDEEELELEEEEDLDADLEEDLEDPFETVTAEEHERIDADPALRKLKKHMEADYTRKSQDVRDREQKAEKLEKQATSFLEAIRTPEGMTAHLQREMEYRPEVIAAALEGVTTGERARDFLVEVGLENVDVFEEAYDRVQVLLTDENEKQRHERARDQRLRELKIAEREKRMRAKTFDGEYGELASAATKEAERLGISDDEDLNQVKEVLNERVLNRVREDGSINMSVADARKAAREVKRNLDRQLEKARKRLERKRVKESREATKRKARKRKKGRSPPKAAARKSPKTPKFEPPENRDPLEAFIDRRLEVE